MGFSSKKKKYKVKLTSGRILGPIDIKRVRKLIDKKQIVGEESAREYPDGEWVDINQLPEIADLLIAKFGGQLDPTSATSTAEGGYQVTSTVNLAPTVKLPQSNLPGTDAEGEPLDELGAPDASLSLQSGSKSKSKSKSKTRVRLKSKVEEPVASDDEGDEKTYVATDPSLTGERTVVAGSAEDRYGKDPTRLELLDHSGPHVDLAAGKTRLAKKKKRQSEDLDTRQIQIAREETVVFDRSESAEKENIDPVTGRKKLTLFQKLRVIFIASALGYFGYETFLEESNRPTTFNILTIKPRLPIFNKENLDIEKSKALYQKGLKFYTRDTVSGYKSAASLFFQACQFEDNPKAQAMLASSYLNLIDSSRKRENYFQVVDTLIQSSQAKSAEYSESIIASAELSMALGQYEAAFKTIVDFTNRSKFGLTMYYYLSEVYFKKKDLPAAAKYVNNIANEQAFSPKVFYLRGKISESFGQTQEAIDEYSKALNFKNGHPKSRLRIADILFKSGKLKESRAQVNRLMARLSDLSKDRISRVFYLHGLLSKSEGNLDAAISGLEKAVKLSPTNTDFRVELYSLRYQAGEKSEKLKRTAKMYYHLGEGEKLVKKRKYDQAKIQFLSARQANLDAVLPLVRIGDMFWEVGDVQNALLNYKKAADKARTNVVVWSKYIATLIESFEWKKTRKAIRKFRSIPGASSKMDKLLGDLYLKQGYPLQATHYYKKAMSRESIDPEVYISYANALVLLKEFSEAPRFYALAQRLDPFNREAIIGTARAVAEAESIDKGISLIEKELQKMAEPDSALLVAIAELYLKKGDLKLAETTLGQVRGTDPEFPDTYRLQAKIYMDVNNATPENLEKALFEFKNYSDRKPSDPSGYLERFKIFLQKNKFDEASLELDRIFALYPKYPNIHGLRGELYATMGNEKAAIKEYQIEIENHPNNVEARLSLGREFIKVNAVSDGLGQFKEAMRLAPNASEPKHMAGYANYLLDNYEAAIALYRAAMRFDQGNPLLYKRLGVAYFKVGQNEKAREALNRYLELYPDADDRQEIEGML